MSVDRNDDAGRYELSVDDRVVGVAEYRRRDGAVVLPHTAIDGQLRGRGYGAVLVRGALDDIRQSGERVVPLCWYVAQFIEEHPEYRDLVAA